jgi:hypothetical protein
VHDGLGGPPDDKLVDEGRYVTVSACMPHSRGDKAMLWADTKDKVALFALNDATQIKGLGNCDFGAGSRFVAAEQVPAKFWEALKRWQKLPPGACVSFVALDGTVTKLTP